MGDDTQKEFNEERIKTLTQTAKGVWFGYLGALAFTGVTLLGIKDVDFFSLDSSTELPLIGVSVPVTAFFWAGALLLAIVYCYLHVFLEQLWVELAAAPARLSDGTPIAQHVHPWLISEFALIMRRWLRREDPAPIEMSPLGYFGVAASAVLGWIAGPFVLFFFWLWSQPAHEVWMTGACAIAFWTALWAGLESYSSLRAKMRSGGHGLMRAVIEKAPLRRGIVTLSLPVLLLVSLMRTEWDYLNYGPDVEPAGSALFDARQWLRPASADLAEASLTELPPDWQTRDTAMKSFFAEWCERPDTANCLDAIDLKADRGFQSEWRAKRATYLRVLSKPNLQGRDLSFANLSRAHLPGADMRGAKFNGANLVSVQMEGADLTGGQMEGADLSFAQMEGADLRGAQMEGADLTGAQMEGADLFRAQMEGADFSLAQMEGANLFRAQMEGADFSLAQMEGADFSLAQMEGADLREAQMEGADFSLAQMEGANLSLSLLTGALEKTNLLQSTNPKASINNGGALRFVDLRNAEVDDLTDWRNSFGDGSVNLPKTISRPCQWRPSDEAALSDEAFFGYWRGWIESSDVVPWRFVAPEGFEDVRPLPPPEGCVWQTTPINSTVP